MFAALRSLGVAVDAAAARAAADRDGLMVLWLGQFRLDVFTPSIEFSWEAGRRSEPHRPLGARAPPRPILVIMSIRQLIPPPLCALGAKVMTLDELHKPTMHKIDLLNASFWSAINHTTDSLGIIERHRVKVWVRNAY